MSKIIYYMSIALSASVIAILMLSGLIGALVVYWGK